MPIACPHCQFPIDPQAIEPGVVMECPGCGRKLQPSRTPGVGPAPAARSPAPAPEANAAPMWFWDLLIGLVTVACLLGVFSALVGRGELWAVPVLAGSIQGLVSCAIYYAVRDLKE